MPTDFLADTDQAEAPCGISPVNPAASFYFSSGPRELIASGLGRAITVPAAGADRPESALQQAVAEGLKRAKAAGQDNPIVVGAIPFSGSEPSCLYIPERYEWRDKRAAAASFAPLPTLLARTTTPDGDGYKSGVRRAAAACDGKPLSKVVLSAMQELVFAHEVDANSIFQRLRAQQERGYQFLLPLADAGLWLGASPELLISKQGARIVSNPLAGSARRMDEPGAAHSAKDHHEHAPVTRKIAAKLGPLCAELEVPARPSLISTKTLWHLSTRIEGRLQDPAISALQLACLLHPTPAVCGYPTAPARDLIAAIEPFKRRFFSGMVGWCDLEGNGEWAVALRCGEVHGKCVRLYAGAGIINSSNPDCEWAEIQTKFGTMLRACGVMS